MSRIKDFSYMKNASWWESRIKHGGYSGGSESPMHYIWRSMLARCLRVSDKSYIYYGARGITVCDRWCESFENFLEDMGERPSPDHSIDRIDVNGNYEPNNCRWATKSEQQRNKTKTRQYCSDNGFIGTLTECAEHVGISKELASWRFKTWGTFIKGEKWHELQKAP